VAARILSFAVVGMAGIRFAMHGRFTHTARVDMRFEGVF
jgi:hypothetical protein